MKSALLTLTGLFFAILTVVSCQKELSVETQVSQGSLKSATGDCLSSVVNGDYKVDSVLTIAEFIDVQVNIITPGKYVIESDSTNGFSFIGEGFVDTSGLNTVRLYAKGKPVSGGIYTFHLNYDTSSCPIEIAVTGTAAVNGEYTIADASGACPTAAFNGIYKSDVDADASNTVEFDVNVTKVGAYTFNTVPVNGITFSGSGSFAATGVQHVVLKASGKPIAAGTFDVGVETCNFSLTVLPDNTPDAAYTLNCTPVVISGSFTEGVMTNSLNTVKISVSVTSLGKYAITTNTVNGIKFSGTGTFANTGLTSVTLTASGTPAAAGVGTFTPQIGSSSCTFDVTVAARTVTTGLFTCKIDGVFTAFNDRGEFSHQPDITGGIVLHLNGFTSAANGENIPEMKLFVLKNDGSPVKTGTYNVDGYLSADGYRIEVDYYFVTPDHSVTLYNTSSTLFTTNPPFTIVITSLTSDRVKGTFSGKVTNINEGSTITKSITEGVFDLPVAN